jgi:hypothetical protein
MKTLANCSPREFLVQTNRIRKSVAKWLTLTKVFELRKRMPKLPANATREEREAAAAEQIQANARAMLDAILDEHPEETAELLGLLCFVEPEDLDNHSMTEFFGAIADILNSKEIIDFFTSLVNLGSENTSGPVKA